MSFNELEVISWKAEISAIKALGLPPREEKARKNFALKKTRKYANKVAIERLLKKITFGRWSPRGPGYINPHVAEDLEAIKKKDDILAQAMHEARKKARKTRDELKENRRKRKKEAAKEKIRRERSFECSPAFFLLDFSQKTCGTPGGADLADLHGALMTWFVNRSSKIDISCVDFDKNDPIGCPKAVFNEVIFYRNIWFGALWTSDFSLNDVDDFLLEKINIFAPVKFPNYPPPSAAAELARLAEKACAAPGSIRSDDLEIIHSWFPGSDIAFTDAVGKNLTGCAKELYLQFLELNRTWPKGKTINYKWINSEARKIKERSKSTPYYPPSRGGGDGGGGYPGPECMKTRCVDI